MKGGSLFREKELRKGKPQLQGHLGLLQVFFKQNKKWGGCSLEFVKHSQSVKLCNYLAACQNTRQKTKPGVHAFHSVVGCSQRASIYCVCIMYIRYNSQRAERKEKKAGRNANIVEKLSVSVRAGYSWFPPSTVSRQCCYCYGCALLACGGCLSFVPSLRVSGLPFA